MQAFAVQGKIETFAFLIRVRSQSNEGLDELQDAPGCHGAPDDGYNHADGLNSQLGRIALQQTAQSFRIGFSLKC